jgi:hypothetical protein
VNQLDPTELREAVAELQQAVTTAAGILRKSGHVAQAGLMLFTLIQLKRAAGLWMETPAAEPPLTPAQRYVAERNEYDR